MTRPIVCTLESELKPGQFVPAGVYARHCRDCDRRVMTSPSSRAVEAEGKAHFACRDCALAGLSESRAVVASLPPGGRDDLRDFDRQDAGRN